MNAFVNISDCVTLHNANSINCILEEDWAHTGHCDTTAALAARGDTLSTLDL